MKNAVITVLVLALWIGVPVVGLAAAALVGGWPRWSVTRWWALIYAAVTAGITTLWTVGNWSPDTASNAIRLAATALAAGALVTTILLWRQPPPARGSYLVRALAPVTCALSAVAWVFVVLIGSPEG